MPILDIFSKRNAPPKSATDVLQYATLPQTLRVQIVHIWIGALGRANDSTYDGYGPAISYNLWFKIVAGLAREYGLPRLAKGDSPFEQAVNFLTEQTDTNKLIDIIELSFRTARTEFGDISDYYLQQNAGIVDKLDNAIVEINHRFLEHSVGYQFEHGRIIKVDTTYAHSEIVKPALTLLSDRRFANAQSEFLAAHQAYREQRNKDCLNECLKAVESTMKIICHEMRWTYQPTDTASRLISVVFDNGLLPAALQTQFNSLKSLLESGTPTTRNRLSGHGQGATAVEVPDYVARYGLNTAAANIGLLVEAFNTLK